jgi:hypothetical protein
MIMTHPHKLARKQWGTTAAVPSLGLAIITFIYFFLYSRESMESLSLENGLDTLGKQLPAAAAAERSATRMRMITTSASASTSTSTTHEDNDRMATAFRNAPIGSLGAKGTQRENYKYYDALFFVALQFGRNAKTLLEVGCSNDPFANYLTWMEERLCVAPYVINYEKARVNQPLLASSSLSSSNNHDAVGFVKADFMEWEAPSTQPSYDIVICGQVLEHVPDPAQFLRKLIQTAKVATIVSVPYKWSDCGKNCHHLHHQIGMHTVLEWAGTENKPVYQSIVTESNGYARLIMVF